MRLRHRSAVTTFTAVIALAAFSPWLDAAPLRFNSLPVLGTGDWATQLIAPDVNNDGVADLVIANVLTADLSLYLADGRGGFGAEQRLPFGYRPISLAAADFDNDGDLDLFVGLNGLQSALVLLGDGAGGFANGSVQPFFMGATRLEVLDIDGDGNLDVLGQRSGDLGIAFGDGAGGFVRGTNIGVPADHWSRCVPTIGDFDEDGLSDVVVITEYLLDPSPTVAFLFRNNATRRPTLAGPFPLLDTAHEADDAVAVDLDGDGHTDIAASAWTSEVGKVVSTFGDGSGGFSSVACVQVPPWQRGLEAADFDDDGDVDLATTSAREGNVVMILRNDGTGRIYETEIIALDFPLLAIAARDFDSDDYPDLACLLDSSYGGSDLASVLVNRSPDLCIRGSVNRGAGAITDVLFVNDGQGDVRGRVRLRTTDPLQIFMAAPPLATAASPFALYAWSGDPAIAAEGELPFGIGDACWPMPLTGGTPQPRVVWNNTGRLALGAPSRPSVPAPSIVVDRPAGLGRGVTFALQGIILDPGSAGTRRASVTNGVVVTVE